MIRVLLAMRLLSMTLIALSMTATASEQNMTAARTAHDRIDAAFDAIIDRATPVELVDCAESLISRHAI